MTPDSAVCSMRVPDSFPLGSAGLWETKRFSKSQLAKSRFTTPKDCEIIGPFETFTTLSRIDYSREMRGLGEVVMEDTERELRRHLPIVLRAAGRVLVSGFGLGCVVRGIVENKNVQHVDVVEIDPAIIKLCAGEFIRHPKVTIHLDDALKVRWPRTKTWDFAWHDIWCEGDGLHKLHMKLLLKYKNLSRFQGAWMLPRILKRMWPQGDRLIG